MPRQTVKNKIIATASTLFYEKGYNLTGVDEVIEKAAIARGSLYYHFSSKEDLLLTCLEDYHRDWYVRLEALLKTLPDARSKILGIFDFRIQNQERVGRFGCPFIKINDEVSGSNKQINAFVRRTKTRLKNLIRDLLSEVNYHGPLSGEDLVEAIYFLLEGGITSTAIFRNTCELQRAREIASKLF